MNATFLSRFTPSMMTPEALESLFVQREELAQRLVELIRESALTPAKHHTLLIGPRGIGKTHLISLIYHRIRAMEDLRDRLLIAWLREEEWGVTSFLDMLLRVFRALLAERADALLAERVESLYGLPPETAERMAGALLKEFVGGRTVLILVENLDDLFKGIGASGQKSWRAYLQGHQFCTMLATSQSLFNGVSLRTSPFYGFFRVNHLEELTLDEAVRLLTNIAELEGDQELASFIQTATGRARVLAVQHIAGGNFRIYAIFSQFLSRKSLDELVEPFMRLLDDLTPYYQSRMAWLSPQQRKIVEFLCDRRGAATVREIAQRCFLSQQTASSQLKILRDMCYVHSIAIGRESFYELHEPLMRLCVEVKKNRGEPIRLLMEFLRLWYSQDELRQRLEGLHPDAVLEREYLSQVLRGTEAEPEDPQVAACLKDFTAHIEAGDFAQAMVAAKELLVIRNEPNDWIRLFICLISLGHLKDASALLGKVIGTEPTTIELVLGSFAIGLSLVTLFLSTNDSEGWRKHIMSLIDFSDQSPQFSACAPMAITWSIPSLRSPDVEEAK
ncbi:MAG: AAA family ATPase, partial [Blastocatellia bacterium]